VDFSRFNVQDTRPQLVRRIKELQPEASNRAIAEAMGMSEITVRRDSAPATYDAPLREEPAPVGEPEVSSATNDAPVLHEDEGGEVITEETPDEEDEDDLPAFFQGDGWSRRERAHAYALYLGLPADVQPTVVAVLA
jgi:hypothetical protein